MEVDEFLDHIHSTKFLTGPFLNSLFLTKRLNHLNEFLPKCVQLKGQKFKGLPEKFSFKPQFLQKYAFFDKKKKKRF